MDIAYTKKIKYADILKAKQESRSMAKKIMNNVKDIVLSSKSAKIAAGALALPAVAIAWGFLMGGQMPDSTKLITNSSTPTSTLIDMMGGSPFSKEETVSFLRRLYSISCDAPFDRDNPLCQEIVSQLNVGP